MSYPRGSPGSRRYGFVAQLVEQAPVKRLVGGSSPPVPATPIQALGDTKERNLEKCISDLQWTIQNMISSGLSS